MNFLAERFLFLIDKRFDNDCFHERRREESQLHLVRKNKTTLLPRLAQKRWESYRLLQSHQFLRKEIYQVSSCCLEICSGTDERIPISLLILLDGLFSSKAQASTSHQLAPFSRYVIKDSSDKL